ncbi:iron uptake protein [Acidovorax sp. SUPP3334]|uniref:iron uptake protein n=1 Tax=Acidovorax sp. SUPP3334 TaxID=2920881 RepID=UPI0023DE3FAE|nr:iron uptake protein [Acidovorax sp. SUPP3334]GKT20768.1 iron uptake protein [Acidovorax sp. SUPP3334]
MAGSTAASRLHVVSRIAAGMLGGYAFTWGFVGLCIGLLFAAGMPFHDAEAMGYIVGFIVFLGAFLWAFSDSRLWRVWLVLAGGGALMSGAASLVQMALV